MTPSDALTCAVPQPGTHGPHRSVAAPSSNGLVAERLRARKRRVAIIRRRVVALTLAIFLALWSLIYLQLATGNDPALTANGAARKAVAAAVTAKATKVTTGSTAGTGSGATTASTNAASSPGTAASSTSSASSSGTAAPSTSSASSSGTAAPSTSSGSTSAITTSQS
jgi:hypothetical protein